MPSCNIPFLSIIICFQLNTLDLFPLESLKIAMWKVRKEKEVIELGQPKYFAIKELFNYNSSTHWLSGNFVSNLSH